MRGTIALVILTALLAVTSQAAAQTTPLQSGVRAGEFDTADRGGQIGGQRIGMRYTLPVLRCPAGQVIVGARIRRGDVLDHVQIACATPMCNAGACQWAGESWGAAAGNPNGGDAHPPMLCANDQMLASVRGRVVVFTQFDYAADFEINCARILGPPNAQGFTPVDAAANNWHHPEGNLGGGYIPPNAGRSTITRPIGCLPNGGATAISTGVADFPVRPGQRVVQALSLYCPANRAAPPAGPDARCPDQLVVAAQVPQDRVVQRWFEMGGRTGGGIVSTMQAEPAERNYTGMRVTETVTLDPASNNCRLPFAGQLCGTGGHNNFNLTAAGTDLIIRLPATNLDVNWRIDAANQRRSFADSHFVFDGTNGRVNAFDLLSRAPPGQTTCRVVCTQTYSCGAAPNQPRTYGPFSILYIFTRDTVTIGGRQVDVTRVDARKR